MIKQFFRSKRNTAIAVAYTFLIALCFCVGFAIGHHNGRGLLTTPVAVTTSTTETPETAEPDAEVNADLYRVIAEDGELRLYCDDGTKSRLIMSDKISEGAFPKEDIAVLREGRMFMTQEEAMAFMENFLS